MKTFMAKTEESQLGRTWYVFDAAGQPLGRLAVEVARVLRGKHKPTFTPHIDTGDFVIVVNAGQAILTGTKGKEPIYHHTGWPGALKSTTRAKEMADKPEEAVRRVVRGMLPHNKLGDAIIKKLKVYTTADHPHEAQQPQLWQGVTALAEQE